MRWKRTVTALALATALAGCATTTSPTGRTQYMAYSDNDLNQAGAQAFAEMKSRQKTVSGGSQNSYVNCVVKALVQQLPPDWRNLPWETAVFVDDAPNAFALPGGEPCGISSIAGHTLCRAGKHAAFRLRIHRRICPRASARQLSCLCAVARLSE